MSEPQEEAANHEAEVISEARLSAERRNRGRNNVFRTVDNPHTPYDPNAAVGDVMLRNDDIESVLMLGSFPIKDQVGNQIGWTNQRLDLLIAAERRRMLDFFDHPPTREEVLASLVNNGMHNKSPEERYRAAVRDKVSDPSVLRALIIGNEPVQKTATEQRQAPPQPRQEQPVQETAQKPAEQTWNQFNLPSMNVPAPRVPVAADKTVALTTPMGRINLSVLDIVQEPSQGFAVIIQRDDAPFVFIPPRGHDKYVIDGIPHPVEFCGISFVYNGTRSTVMVMVN